MRSNVLVRHQGLSSMGTLNEDVDEINNIFMAILISLKVTLQLLLTQHSKYKLGGKKQQQQRKLYTGRSKPDVQVSTNLFTSHYCTENPHFSNSKQNWALCGRASGMTVQKGERVVTDKSCFTFICYWSKRFNLSFSHRLSQFYNQFDDLPLISDVLAAEEKVRLESIPNFGRQMAVEDIKSYTSPLKRFCVTNYIFFLHSKIFFNSQKNYWCDEN